jgi:glycosyltransferase involved in cell wall biosynthesis
MIGVVLLTLVPGELGGAETYARELVAALARRRALDLVAFTPPVARGAGGGLPERVVERYGEARTLRERFVATTRALVRPGPLRAEMTGIDAAHYPLAIAAPPLPVPYAVTIHDLQHLDLPGFFSRAERLWRRLTHERSARRAQAVIVPSEFVRRNVVTHLGIPPERVRAIAHGVDHERFRPGGDEREPFLLYPARPWPHKNHARLFEAFALLRRERPELELVLTGGGHDERDLPPGVRWAGLVSPDELASLYRRAACLVFPSLYEGFGVPPLEAMASGCPVACARAASLPEVVGEAGVLFDPLDPAAIAAGVREALERAGELRARGLEHAARFTWEATAAAHEEVYRSLLSA